MDSARSSMVFGDMPGSPGFGAGAGAGAGAGGSAGDDKKEKKKKKKQEELKAGMVGAVFKAPILDEDACTAYSYFDKKSVTWREHQIPLVIPFIGDALYLENQHIVICLQTKAGTVRITQSLQQLALTLTCGGPFLPTDNWLR